MSFSENVVLADTSYNVLGPIILRLGNSLKSFNKDNSVNFLVKSMYNEAIRGVYYLRKHEKLK